MARIRNIKPSFFRHEELQQLEVDHPGKYIMLVFIGLWGHCDSNGNFEFKPKTLKLDILPFIEFDMADTLKILLDNKFFETYEVKGRVYGSIPTFNTHQRLSGKEVKEGVKFPVNEERSTCEAPVKPPGAQERSTGKEYRKGVTQISLKLHTFKNSEFFQKQKFLEALKQVTGLPKNVNGEYYYKRACKGNYQYKDWIEAVSEWILQDEKNNVLNGLKKKTVAGTSNKTTPV